LKKVSLERQWTEISSTTKSLLPFLVRNYHKSYYRPDNLCLIVTGKVEKNELLKALEPVEESIIERGPLPEMQRPWVSTGSFPNLEKDIEETVLFADEDESMGSVLLAWNGPMCHVSKPWNQFKLILLILLL
jgi:Zn-dependent M16 (insulinase) family peptidase